MSLERGKQHPRYRTGLLHKLDRHPNRAPVRATFGALCPFQAFFSAIPMGSAKPGKTHLRIRESRWYPSSPRPLATKSVFTT